MSKFKFGPNQEKWLAELESGDNLQCRQSLIEVDNQGNVSYCCLGLAADKVLNLEKTNSYFKDGECRLIDFLDNNVYKKLGLFSPEGTIKDYCEEKSLAELNDDYRFSFNEIAKFIRKNPEQVFSESV